MNPEIKPGTPGLHLVEFKRVDKGALQGFATIDVPIGAGARLRVHDVAVFRMGERAWANLPAKPLIGRDGEPIRDQKNGKPRYSAILEWSDRAVADRFSEAVVALVEAQQAGTVR